MGSLNQGKSCSHLGRSVDCLLSMTLMQGSPAWLQTIVSGMTPKDRVHVEALPEWQTFVVQAPKIVDGVEGRVVHLSTSHLKVSRFCHRHLLKPPNVSLKICSRQAEKWTNVRPWLTAQ